MTVFVADCCTWRIVGLTGVAMVGRMDVIDGKTVGLVGEDNG
jgi:hypothetical protein